MDNYNFTQEIINDIETNLESLINNLITKNISLKEFNLIDNDFLKDKFNYFDKNFRLIHEEIRGNIKKVRHFILRKKEKLNKELTSPLIFLNILDILDETDRKTIWDFLHLSFLIYENYHINKNDLIVNTLIEEINKNKTEKIDEENIQDKFKDMLSNLGSNKDIENLTSMFKNFADTEGKPDLQKMFKSFLPNMNTNVNDNLTKELIMDIKKSLSNTSNADDIFNSTKQLGEKYQEMISSGKIDTSEIISSLVGLIDNTELSNELSSMDLSNMPKPEEMLNKLVGEMPENFNIGSVISALGNETKKKEEPNIELTEQQVQELQEYYEQIKISN
jgi:hypothetical protein